MVNGLKRRGQTSNSFSSSTTGLTLHGSRIIVFGASNALKHPSTANTRYTDRIVDSHGLCQLYIIYADLLATLLFSAIYPLLEGNSQDTYENLLLALNLPVDVTNVSILLFGVPQGSVLRPILFTIYTLPIDDIARTHGLNVHFYADDTQLYKEFNPTDHEDTTSVLTQVGNCISDIRIWKVEKKLKHSDDKTEVLILTSKLHKSIHCISQVVVGGAPIAPTLTVRNLGAMFDNHSPWTTLLSTFVRLFISTFTIFHPSESVFRKSLLSHSYMLLSVAGLNTAIPCLLA
ncbi:hypothetical protein LSH36_45g01033 [Paralvinella palmiformis]|uniref:Reverse transcriptase domain-containing protein n=1 Tax=Paralvinella palmiformis TaxID=53620 RepID=A0AAD9K6U1_9ANNE|nr:hypothetical protein LSH36_45g01033 [Paralvinella palmiformis]